jgi:hypothetical protein
VKKYRVLTSFVFSLTYILSCGGSSGVSAVRAGDYSIVGRGTYRGQLEFQGDGGDLESVKKLRTEIEQDEMIILDMISDRFYTIPHAPYEFKFAAIDESSDRLVLRYFARIFEHPIYAGYQIQFVFVHSSGKLLRILTAEVPLE